MTSLWNPAAAASIQALALNPGYPFYIVCWTLHIAVPLVRFELSPSVLIQARQGEIGVLGDYSQRTKSGRYLRIICGEPNRIYAKPFPSTPPSIYL